MIDQDELCIPTTLYNSNFEQRKKMPVPVELVAHISNSKIIGIQGQSRLQSKTLFWEDGRKGGRKGKREGGKSQSWKREGEELRSNC